MRPLDNPIWESLASRHSPLALGRDGVLRYPAEIAPFLGVREPDLKVDTALHELVAPGEETLVIGPLPQAPEGWTLEPLFGLVQMECPEPLPEVPGPTIIELGAEHLADIHELVALVYPHYFRPRTTQLGDRKSTRLNSSHVKISYAVFCLKKKNETYTRQSL